MNQSNRKRQYIDQQENEANSEWSFNFEEDNNGTNIGNSTGNELREMTLKMAALEVTTVFCNKTILFWRLLRIIRLFKFNSQKMPCLKPKTRFWKENWRIWN
jgi:hypothetical protein